MASTVITPVADAVTRVLRAIVFDPPLWVPTTDSGGAAWAPSRIQEVPAAVINVPTVRRTALDEGERELGSDDWILTFGVDLYVDLKVAQRDQQRIVDLLEAVIAAIDDDPSMGIPTIDDAKVVAGTPEEDYSDEARPLLHYGCELEVWQRVPYDTAP